MTGKLADTVMSVRNGEQIARKYQPVVFNPSTPAQVAQRAKMKLMSQLSAVMAPVIAMRRTGSVSPRNLFTKYNFKFATFLTDTADVTLNDIQLTKSVVALPRVGVGRQTTAIWAYMELASETDTVDVDRVVYAMFVKQNDNRLRFVASRVATAAGTTGNWGVTDFPLINDEVVVYAYGVRDNTENAKTVFGDMQAISAEAVAKLIVTSALTETDITLTETRAFTLPAVSTQNSHAPENENRSVRKK